MRQLLASCKFGAMSGGGGGARRIHLRTSGRALCWLATIASQPPASQPARPVASAESCRLIKRRARLHVTLIKFVSFRSPRFGPERGAQVGGARAPLASARSLAR